MKPQLTILILAAAASAALAQTQERKLMDRMMKPDMQQANVFQNKAFDKVTPVSIRQASESKDGYAGIKSANIRDYPFTRSFLGIKNPWFGGKVFDTKAASTWSKSAVVNADREVPVRKAEVAGYWGATKQANFGSPVVPVRPFIPQPAAQGAVSQITDKINDKMTIDEVRELLNKPR